MDWGTCPGLIITMKYLFQGNEELNAGEGQKSAIREWKIQVLIHGDGIVLGLALYHSVTTHVVGLEKVKAL